MRILLINQFYEPDPAATAQVASHLARRLAARGHEVTALASRWSHIRRGERLPARERIGGVDVQRVGGTDFGRGTVAGRIIDTATFYALLGARAILGTRADAVILMTSPPMVETLGPVLKLLSRKRWVACWLMDLNPDIAVEMGVMPARHPLMRLCAAAGRWAMRGMDHLIAIGPCMADRVVRTRGVDARRVSVVETGADPAALVPREHAGNAWRREQGLEPDRLLVMYSGNMGVGHPLGDFLEAHRRMTEGGADPGFELFMIGAGSRRREPEAYIAERAPAHFRLMPYQPAARLNESLAAADVHLISMAGNMTGAFIPSKVYGIMSVGRPFIYVGPADSTVARIAREGPCGLVVEPGDVEGLVSALRRLASDAGLRERLGSAGRRLLETKYAQAACEERFIGILESRVGAAPAAASAERTPAAGAA